MKTARIGLLTLIILIASLAVCLSAAQAFVAPIQDVTASLTTQDGKDVLTFSVWDPVTMAEVSGSRSYDQIVNATVKEGIVAFIGKVFGGYVLGNPFYLNYLECWVYDPTVQQWIGDTWDVQSFSSRAEVVINNGVVTYRDPHRISLFETWEGSLLFNTYDPQRGWMHGPEISYGFPVYLNENGIVAAFKVFNKTPPYGFIAYAFIYDPRDGEWKSWNSGVLSGFTTTDFSIQTLGNFAWFAQNGSGVISAGYDPVNRAFITNQMTNPLSYFYAAPLSGTRPLKIWFIDLSIGGTGSCTYDFGDGSGSSSRSDQHIYNAAGQYTLSQTVTHPYTGSAATSSQTISVAEAPPPPGSIIINNGAQWTNQRTVYLSLTTQPGIYISLKNGVNGSYGTEFLYDPVADANYAYDLWPFFLPPLFVPDGTYTIYARFRDASNDTTYETSAAIKADVHAPTLPTLSTRRTGIQQVTLNWEGEWKDGYYTGLLLNQVWHPGSGILWWKLNRGNTPDGINFTVYGAIGTPSFSSWTDSSQLQTGKTYYYQLQAMDNVGNLATGPVVQVSLVAPTGALELLLLAD